MQTDRQQHLDNLYNQLQDLKQLRDNQLTEEELAHRPNSRMRMMLDSTRQIEWLKRNPDKTKIDYFDSEISLMKKIVGHS
jgi:hypothetical protein